MPHRDARRVDAQFLTGDLRQGGFQSLPVRLDADRQHDAAVGQDARGAAFETGHHRGTTTGVLGSAVRGLLVEAREPNSNQPSVGLTPLLSFPDAREVQQFGAAP